VKSQSVTLRLKFLRRAVKQHRLGQLTSFEPTKLL